MLFLNYLIFLFIYYTEACYKVPNCDYSVFERQIKVLKFDNKKIRERLDMMQSLLDNQIEFTVSVETKIVTIQQSLKVFEDKLTGFDNNKPPVDAYQVITTPSTSIEEHLVATTPITSLVVTTPITSIDYTEDNEYKEDICPIDYYPSDCTQSNSKFCAESKCRIQNHLYGKQPFMVSCDDKNGGGGWTVIQRRINGSIDFYRNWLEYKNGFGNIEGEFFIGLDKLYALTNSLKPVELFVLLQDFKGKYKYAKYSRFIIGSESNKYKLKKVGKYSGNAGDSFSQHQGNYFTTKDMDNDTEDQFNCAANRLGAWWYKKCFWSNLNGIYYDDGKVPRGKAGICWSSFHGYNYSLKFVQMMIRPKRRTVLNE